MLRSLLYETANSLLMVVRRAHPLKDGARSNKKRTPHKKVCVALARKLAVILHRMLTTGEEFRWLEKEAAAMPFPWVQGAFRSANAPQTLGRRSQRAQS